MAPSSSSRLLHHSAHIHMIFFISLLMLILATSYCASTVVVDSPTVGEKGSEVFEKANEKSDQIKQNMEETTNEGKEKTEQIKQKMEETEKEAKEGSESWTNWAKEKLTEGLGYKQQDSDVIETAKQSPDEEAAMNKAEEGKETAKQKGTEYVETAKQKGTEYVVKGKEKAQEGYDAAKAKAGETIEKAKDTISSNFEAAKHKTQDVKENLGGGSQARDAEL